MTKRKTKPQPILTATPPLALEWRTPAELADNPSQWKTHPPAQMAGLAAVMQRLEDLDDGDTSGGWAGAALYNLRTERLVDAHARKRLAEDRLVDGARVGRPGERVLPVLVGTWNEEQEALILRTLDPLGALAAEDEAKRRELTDRIRAAEKEEETELREILDRLEGEDQPEPAGESPQALEPVDLAAPEKVWVLIGVDLAGWGPISPLVEEIADRPGIFCEVAGR